MKKIAVLGILGAFAAGMFAHQPIEPIATTETQRHIDRAARRRAARAAKKRNRK